MFPNAVSLSNRRDHWKVSNASLTEYPGAHREFATSFAVYQRATGKGAIKDLFVDMHPDEQKPPISQVQMEEGVLAEPGHLQRVDTVQHAQQVMDQETTKIDNHHKIFP